MIYLNSSWLTCAASLENESYITNAGPCAGGMAMASESPSPTAIHGLTGRVSDVRVAVEAPKVIAPLPEIFLERDTDLKRMADWAMNYLIRTPNKDFDYEPVFQCHPLRCPPAPKGRDVVVPCDTDARMNWEWYYMRDVSGSTEGEDIEKGFHHRMLSYVQKDGTVLAPPGCYNEGDINKVYKKEDYVYHIWGATKILQALAEDFRRTGNLEAKGHGQENHASAQEGRSLSHPRQMLSPGRHGAAASGRNSDSEWLE